MQRSYDMLLVGGGLANGLIAATVLERVPQARLLLIEQGPTLGGNHTWSFLTSDLSAAQRARLCAWATSSWAGYTVHFPKYQRTLHAPYHSLTSAAFDTQVRRVFAERPNVQLRLAQRVARVEEDSVTLDDGEVLTARCVLDGRGPELNDTGKIAGFQKFLGLELTLQGPWPVALPTLMDANVEQFDGFRFVYVLPITPTRVLVEDTYYSVTPHLDHERLRQRIYDYVASQGVAVASVVREEFGVLPLPRRPDQPRTENTAVRVGYRGGWFHPTTGYSMAQACRVADHVADCLVGGTCALDLPRLWREFRSARGFACALNKLLFDAFASHDQRNVLERFYRLPEPLIARFYSLEMTVADKARIICGRPPQGFSLQRLLQGAHPE